MSMHGGKLGMHTGMLEDGDNVAMQHYMNLGVAVRRGDIKMFDENFNQIPEKYKHGGVNVGFFEEAKAKGKTAIFEHMKAINVARDGTVKDGNGNSEIMKAYMTNDSDKMGGFAACAAVLHLIENNQDLTESNMLTVAKEILKSERQALKDNGWEEPAPTPEQIAANAARDKMNAAMKAEYVAARTGPNIQDIVDEVSAKCLMVHDISGNSSSNLGLYYENLNKALRADNVDKFNSAWFLLPKGYRTKDLLDKLIIEARKGADNVLERLEEIRDVKDLPSTQSIMFDVAVKANSVRVLTEALELRPGKFVEGNYTFQEQKKLNKLLHDSASGDKDKMHTSEIADKLISLGANPLDASFDGKVVAQYYNIDKMPNGKVFYCLEKEGDKHSPHPDSFSDSISESLVAESAVVGGDDDHHHHDQVAAAGEVQDISHLCDA